MPSRANCKFPQHTHKHTVWHTITILIETDMNNALDAQRCKHLQQPPPSVPRSLQWQLAHRHHRQNALHHLPKTTNVMCFIIVSCYAPHFFSALFFIHAPSIYFSRRHFLLIEWAMHAEEGQSISNLNSRDSASGLLGMVTVSQSGGAVLLGRVSLKSFCKVRWGD